MTNHTTTPVRVRFAPSPTGFLHIGGIRSALHNWLWARHNQGAFLLRIEDTDRSRYVEGATDQILESLSMLSLDPDEPPTTQSRRLDLYHRESQRLVESGSLYRCWCQPERLDALRKEAQQKGQAFKYDRHCLDPGNHRSQDEPHVLRFRIPESPETVAWHDAVRGALSVNITELDDFVALKSDGYPTYHLANVIDDHDMAISHVLRADEWLPSTPKHLLLFAALGWQPPVYAHLPAIQGPDGKKKLSKRDGAQAVSDYVHQGYLPEALVNFLASLGWNDGTTQEIYSTDELIKGFTLERIQRSPARFDIERLNWMNGVYIRQLSTKDLAERAAAFWPEGSADYDDQYRHRVLKLVHERLKFLAELPELTAFFFQDPTPDAKLLTGNFDAPTAKGILEAVAKTLEGTVFTEENLESRLRALVAEKDLKAGKAFGLVRVAVTGKTAAPGLFETLATLGKDAVLRRLSAADAALRR